MLRDTKGIQTSDPKKENFSLFGAMSAVVRMGVRIGHSLLRLDSVLGVGGLRKKWRLPVAKNDRLFKFFIGVGLMPVLVVVGVIIIAFSLLLPVIAIFKPECITINKKMRNP